MSYKLNDLFSLGLGTVAGLGNCGGGYTNAEGAFVAYNFDDDDDDDDDDDCDGEDLDNLMALVSARPPQTIKLMMFRFFLNALFLTLPMALLAQQTVRGTITDKDSKQTISFATIVVKNSNPILGVISDKNGKFTLNNVPIGKQTLTVSFVGYKNFTLPNINVTAGKELVL